MFVVVDGACGNEVNVIAYQPGIAESATDLVILTNFRARPVGNVHNDYMRFRPRLLLWNKVILWYNGILGVVLVEKNQRIIFQKHILYALTLLNVKPNFGNHRSSISRKHVGYRELIG